jgi:hypothetical protein
MKQTVPLMDPAWSNLRGYDEMLNLESISGLPMGLDENGQIVFGPDMVVDEAKARLVDGLTKGKNQTTFPSGICGET